MRNTDLPLIEVNEIPNEPVNQWHAQLLKQANELPVSQKFWDEKPKTVVNQYEWGSIEYRR